MTGGNSHRWPLQPQDPTYSAQINITYDGSQMDKLGWPHPPLCTLLIENPLQGRQRVEDRRRTVTEPETHNKSILPGVKAFNLSPNQGVRVKVRIPPPPNLIGSPHLHEPLRTGTVIEPCSVHQRREGALGRDIHQGRRVLPAPSSSTSSSPCCCPI